MTRGNALFITGAIVIYKHFAKKSFFQHFFTLPRRRQIRQGRFPLLKPSPIKPIGTIHVYSTQDVAHVVRDEGPAVDDQEGLVPGPTVIQLRLEAIGVDGGDLLQHQSPLERRTFRAWTRGQANTSGLQLEPFRRTKQDMGRRRRAWFAQAPVQRQFEAISGPIAFETHCRHDAL